MAVDDGAAVKQGFRSQIGFGEESSYNTRVAPDRFYEFRSEGLSMARNRLESQAVRNRHFQTRWGEGSRGWEGDVAFELANRGFGRIFEHAFGSVATTQPDSTNAPNVYDHEFTPGDLVGYSLTVQVGRDDLPFDLTGGKVGSLQIACSTDEIAVITASLVGADEATDQSMASASYPDIELMTFVHGSLSIAGSEVAVNDFSGTLNNGLNTDRRRLGSGIRRNPQRTAFRDFSGTFNADFTDLTMYNRFVNGDEAALVLLFEGSAIEDTYNYQVQITSNIRFDGDTPTVGGLEEIRQPVSWKAFPTTADGDDGACTLLYRTDDSSP